MKHKIPFIILGMVVVGLIFFGWFAWKNYLQFRGCTFTRMNLTEAEKVQACKDQRTFQDAQARAVITYHSQNGKYDVLIDTNQPKYYLQVFWEDSLLQKRGSTYLVTDAEGNAHIWLPEGNLWMHDVRGAGATGNITNCPGLATRDGKSECVIPVPTSGSVRMFVVENSAS